MKGGEKNMFFKPVKADSHEAFLDAVVSLQSDDSTVYYGAKAIRNSDVFSAIRILASDIASSPIQLFIDGKLKNKDKYFNLLNVKPNDQVDGFHFKFALVANMLLNGNSYAEIDNIEDPQELKFIKNSSMTVKQDEDNGKLIYEVSNSKNKVRRVPANKILHFKYFTQDGVTGISPLLSLKDELLVQGSGNQMLKNFYKSGINSNGILNINKSDLSADSKNNIREKFEEANAGTGNSSRTIVLDSSMKYEPIEVNADVLKMVNSNDWSSKQIAKAFGLSSYQLGIEESHSNIAQTNLNYINNTLGHYFDVITAELGFKLLSDEHSESHFNFNTDKLLSVDPQTNLQNTIQAVQGSILTINEGRKKLNLEPVENGDDLLISLNYTHLSNLDNYQNTRTGNGSEVIE